MRELFWVWDLSPMSWGVNVRLFVLRKSLVATASVGKIQDLNTGLSPSVNNRLSASFTIDI